MGDGRATGITWIGLLLLYFAMMTLIVSIIAMAVGGEISSTLDYSKVVRCTEPRNVYSSYSTEYNSTDEMTSNNRIREGLSHVDCSKSIGVLGNDTCMKINGCNWTSPTTSFWEQFMWWRNTTTQPTCMGQFNETYYNLTLVDSVFFPTLDKSKGIAAHNFSSLTNGVGSICSSPSVINNPEFCETFSCTWGSDYKISEIMIEDMKFDTSLGATMWKTISEMFTFRFSFGFDNVFIDYFLNFLIFYLPLILLIGALYTLIPVI